MINSFWGDCMKFMQGKPDKYYDLVCADPPYGGGGTAQWDTKKHGRFGQRFDRYFEQSKVTRTGGTWAAKYQTENVNIKNWDYSPPPEYFEELFRVSKHQIIWGGNYFPLPPTRCFLIWRKLTISEAFSMAMVEYAWTSFNSNAKIYECAPQGNPKDPRFHPTQKPIALYKWILSNYAQKGDKLLDTHGGSFSSAIAAYELGLDMDICEINETYFTKGKARLERYQRQQFFDFEEVVE